MSDVHIIRTDGTEEHRTVPEGSDLAPLIGAKCLDVVNLRDGRLMMVDDGGYEALAVRTDTGIQLVPTRARKPVNSKATALYWKTCYPGTTHEIVGDVVIVRDEP